MPPKKKKKKNILPDDERFNLMDDEEHKKKRKTLINHNTVKADEKAQRLFIKWLTLRGIHTDYWDLSVQELDDLLCKFYFEVRTEEGDNYKKSSLGALRYGLNRCLHKKGYEFDIVHGTEFKKSTAAYLDACKELKALGKAERESYKEIIPKGNYKDIFIVFAEKNKNVRSTK